MNNVDRGLPIISPAQEYELIEVAEYWLPSPTDKILICSAKEPFTSWLRAGESDGRLHFVIGDFKCASGLRHCPLIQQCDRARRVPL